MKTMKTMSTMSTMRRKNKVPAPTKVAEHRSHLEGGYVHEGIRSTL